MGTKMIVATFDNEHDLLDATRAARDGGLTIYDTFVPYAVHGLDEAMGLRNTRLGIVCFLMALTGLTAALSFQLWALGWNWPMNIGGKSFTALPALIPVTFEMTILFGGVGTALTFLIRAKLWPGRKELQIETGVTDDRFVLVIEDSGDEDENVKELLQQNKPLEVREVELTQ